MTKKSHPEILVREKILRPPQTRAKWWWHLNISVTPSDFRPLPHPFVLYAPMDRRELFVPQTRTTIAMSRSFSVIALSLWNRLPPSARAALLSSIFLRPYHFLRLLFSWS